MCDGLVAPSEGPMATSFENGSKRSYLPEDFRDLLTVYRHSKCSNKILSYTKLTKYVFQM
jgi:hypothetical protein